MIGYSPTERPSDAWFSIACQASGVAICFLHGAKLPDPAGILVGSGNQVRSIRLPTAATLKEPAVAAMIDASLAHSKIPVPATGRGTLIIRAISAKQRPRRKAD